MFVVTYTPSDRRSSQGNQNWIEKWIDEGSDPHPLVERSQLSDARTIFRPEDGYFDIALTGHGDKEGAN